MWIYPFVFFINVILLATIGSKTNDWVFSIFITVALGVILIMVMLCEMYRDINKKMKESDKIES
jgi:uncharacterized membrane protein YhaH (DUF805 family)